MPCPCRPPCPPPLHHLPFAAQRANEEIPRATDGPSHLHLHSYPSHAAALTTSMKPGGSLVSCRNTNLFSRVFSAVSSFAGNCRARSPDPASAYRVLRVPLFCSCASAAHLLWLRASAPRHARGLDPFDSAQGHPEPVERMSLSETASGSLIRRRSARILLQIEYHAAGSGWRAACRTRGGG